MVVSARSQKALAGPDYYCDADARRFVDYGSGFGGGAVYLHYFLSMAGVYSRYLRVLS